MEKARKSFNKLLGNKEPSIGKGARVGQGDTLKSFQCGVLSFQQATRAVDSRALNVVERWEVLCETSVESQGSSVELYQ